MTTTLLTAVNDVLKKVDQIAGDAGDLTTLTDGPRQPWIDATIMHINESIDDLFERVGAARPVGTGTSTITLVASTREYDLPSDLVQVRFPLVDETNGLLMVPYPGGYERLRADQTQPDNYTGVPSYAVINPSNGKLRVDRTPNAAEAGRIYQLLYDKDTKVSAADDTLPISDAAWRAMRTVVSQLVRREMQNDYDAALVNRAYGRAASILKKTDIHTGWGTRTGYARGFDPYAE